MKKIVYIMQSMKKISLFRKVFFIGALSFYSLSAAFALKDYEVSFAKGNLDEKQVAVKLAAEDGNGMFILKSLDFAVQSFSILGPDNELVNLVESSVKLLNESNCRGNERLASLKLVDTFRAFDNHNVRIAIIDAFSVFPSVESVQLVNDFFSKSMQESNSMNDLLLKCILFMGSSGNSTSFSLLFIADVLEVWPSYCDILANAYGNIVEKSEKDILNMLASVPVEKKLRILERISGNQKIPQKIRGEVAENALLSVIYSKEENPVDYNGVQIKIQMLSLEVLKETRWTRASKTATDFFRIARNEYESGKITPEEFSSVIGNITSIASAETGSVLAAYLDFLNKQTEKKSMPVKAVLLSVINSLGELGDKTAFDYLLYVTYLDYPEDVVFAARSALAKLKW